MESRTGQMSCDLIVDMRGRQRDEIALITDKILLAYCAQLELKIASFGELRECNTVNSNFSGD